MMATKADFYDFTMSHVRLSVLRSLADSPSYAMNDSVLSQRLDDLGFPITRDQLRSQLGWLEEVGLIECTRPVGTLIVAKLRERGADVAAGRAHVDGVQRPAPSR